MHVVLVNSKIFCNVAKSPPFDYPPKHDILACKIFKNVLILGNRRHHCENGL